MDSLRISGIVNDSIVDGPGLRTAIFVQGCPHHCDGCHNPDTHDFNGGKLICFDDIISKIKENPLLSGVTFSGGEPFCQAGKLALLGKQIKSLGLNIITFTGYTFEELLDMPEEAEALKLLSVTDILVDGKFDKSQRDMNLLFRGTKNQRVIDVKKSLETGRAVITEF